MGGKTFPFRGKGTNLMPTLDEVLTHFPDRSFLIHIKSDDENEGIQLPTYLKKLPAKRLDQLTVYGGDKPIAAIKERIPGLRIMSKATIHIFNHLYFKRRLINNVEFYTPINIADDLIIYRKSRVFFR